MDELRDEIANQEELLEHSECQNDRLREEMSRLSEHVDGARDEIANQEEMLEDAERQNDELQEEIASLQAINSGRGDTGTQK